MSNKIPLPGQIYEHYKGGRYEIVSMATHSETDKILVIYKSINFGSVHARPYKIWNDIVSKDEYGPIKRFTFMHYAV